MLNRPIRRRTNQREAILDELRKLRTHPTADELYRLVRLRFPKISMATVYRNLEVLCAEGLAQKIELHGVQRRFDGDPTNHYHVRCIACGRVEDVDLEPIAIVEELFRGRSEYKVLSHRLEFIGFCPDCLSSNSEHVNG